MSQPSLTWRCVQFLYFFGLLLHLQINAMHKLGHRQHLTARHSPEEVIDVHSSPFEHSAPIPFMYASRTLDWLVDPRKALATQGYLKEHLTPRHLTMCVMRHRLPTVIEQYYRHLAIYSRVEKGCEPGFYDSLNFPGELITPEQNVLRGVFEIGSDPARNNEICHRYFHYAQKKPEFAKAFAQHDHIKTLFPRQIDSGFTLIGTDDTYTIHENAFMVRITDHENATYVLYKNTKKKHQVKPEIITQ